MRERQAAVLQRCADSFTRFLDFGVGQPDQGERRQAIGQMDLNRDRRRSQAIQRTAVNNGQ